MSLFHRHRRKVTEVQHGKTGEGYCCTCILLMCDCGGSFEAVTVPGIWTVEDLTPKQQFNDARWCKEAGIKLPIAVRP